MSTYTRPPPPRCQEAKPDEVLHATESTLPASCTLGPLVTNGSEEAAAVESLVTEDPMGCSLQAEGHTNYCM